MKIVLLTGSHPRHLFLAKTLLDQNLLTGLLIEERGELVPSPPEDLSGTDYENYVKHFDNRAKAEKRRFSEVTKDEFDNISTINVVREELNSVKVEEWIEQQDPDVVLSYGVHIIEDQILKKLPEYSWNIHGGLSPWYRGCITLFWPFYFLEPNWAGMTIHYLSSELDGGHIVHHSVPDLKYGDGIHDVATRAVEQVANDLVIILNKLKSGEKPPKEKQKSSGKLFLAKDWRPEHLRLIYNTFDNDIVNQYLNGELDAPEPDLVRAF